MFKKIIIYTLGIILISIIAHIFIFELYLIPSNSMENTLYPGDKIIVNKLYYGPRLPRSGSEIPWLNFFGDIAPKIKKMDKKKWDHHRLLGLKKITNGDVVVFNSRNETTNFLIKRCVGLPGDSLKIVNKNLYINNQQVIYSDNIKTEYIIYYRQLSTFLNQLYSLKYVTKKSKDQFYLNLYKQLTLNKSKHPSKQIENEGFIMCNMSLRQKNIIQNLPSVKFIKPHTVKQLKNEPYNTNFLKPTIKYNRLVVPKKGMKIALTERNHALYKDIIKLDTKVDTITIEKGLYNEEKQMKTYEFKQNWYYMLGDNRDNSIDSRYFGFVPEHNIVGKATKILFSKNQDGDIRWNRVLKRIK